MSLELTQLEQQHANFYAPAYRVVVDKKDLLAELYLQIPTVQVDLTLEGMHRFSFTVNSTFDIQRREFDHLDVFAFGKPVDIYLGYIDGDTLPLMHKGIITSVQTSFPASGLPQINVSGYDLSYPMTKGKKS